MSYIGTSKVGGMYLGDTKIGKAYLGDDLVYSAGPSDPYILKRGNTFNNRFIDILYSESAIASTNGVRLSEALAYTGTNGDGVFNIRDKSPSGTLTDGTHLQYFTNLNNISYASSNYPTNVLVLMPSSITTFTQFALYRLNSLNCRVVFLGLTPPTTVSKYALGYSGQKCTFYFPDDSYQSYVTKFSNITSYCTGCEVKRISELSSDDFSKIKMPII